MHGRGKRRVKKGTANRCSFVETAGYLIVIGNTFSVFCIPWFSKGASLWVVERNLKTQHIYLHPLSRAARRYMIEERMDHEERRQVEGLEQ